MPHIELKVYPGYDREKLEKLSSYIVDGVEQILNVPNSVISLAIEEVTPGNWDANVHQPLICGREMLLKSPNYFAEND